MRLVLKKSLPFNDINGKAIYEGDTVEDLQGQRGVVQYDIWVRDPENCWSIDFGRGSLIPFVQIGKAVLKIDTPV